MAQLYLTNVSMTNMLQVNSRPKKQEYDRKPSESNIFENNSLYSPHTLRNAIDYKELENSQYKTPGGTKYLRHMFDTREYLAFRR